jgi:hypothetical protein
MIRNSFFLMGCMSLMSLGLAAQGSYEPGVDSTGLPGDNFSLQGALEMFRQAASPEEFERFLNTEDNHVNNLDLDGDGETDYIRVIDKMEKNTHVLILQVAVSETENQDIATIEIEKTGESNAVLQIVGDEDIYGQEVIVEPNGEEGGTAYQSSGVGHGPFVEIDQPGGIIVNVWLWPSVRFIYAPSYVIWRSPWRWRAYPAWWRPWRPAGWHVFHPYLRPYHTHFVVVHTNRVAFARTMYRPVRSTSVIVHTRNQASVNHYRVTRSRTTITGPRGHSVSRTRTSVERRGSRGKAIHTIRRRR